MKTRNENKYILAIDHGSSGLKTSLISVYGKIIDFEFEGTQMSHLPDGGSEQDPVELWRATVNTCKKLVEKKSVPPEDIVGMCVSSTFSSTVAVDKEGRHLMNVLTWADTRGSRYIKDVVGGLIELEGYSVSNLLRWIPKTAGIPTLSGKDDIAHMLYVKYEHPEIYNNTHMFLGSKDYLNLQLTGEFASSPDSMMLFWVINTKDINNLHYDDKLIKKLKIDKNKLPPLMTATDVLGPVKPEVADEIGISRDVKVVIGSPDLQSAGVGAGTVEDYQGHIYIGTGSWLQCVVPYQKTDLFHQIAAFPHAIPGKYYTADAQDIAGGCLAFFRDNFILHENELNLNKGDNLPENMYQVFDQIAERVPPGSGKVIFTPWLHGERTPIDSTTLRGGFHNLSLTTNMDHMVRAIFEGVAYNTRWMMFYVEKFIKRKLDMLRIVGGGGNSNVWCQIFADVLDREIMQISDPIQCNARGAAFLASVGLGYITVAEIPDLVEYTNTYYPNPENRALYDNLYEEFLFIYKSSQKMYKRLNSV